MRVPLPRLAGLALAVGAVLGLQADASARTRAHRRSAPWIAPSPTVTVAPPPPPAIPARVEVATSCSCTSRSDCPQIGTLAIPGFKRQPLYCNQLNGAENPGVHGRDTWYYQCAELSNRWLVESVGAPPISGHARSMCDNADRSAFDVHTTAHEPVPGDLLIWGGHAYGHVAVVVSVSSAAVVVANQNYGGNGRQYPFLEIPRTGGFFGSPRTDRELWPRCIIHPRKLGGSSPSPAAPTRQADACARVPPSGDGTYCGASRQSGFAGGDARALFTCNGGRTTAVRTCRNGCALEPAGTPDHCM